MVLYDMLTLLESRQLLHYRPTPGRPWRTVEKRDPPSRQNFKSWIWLSFCLKWEMTKWIYTNLWVVGNRFTKWSGTQKEHSWKIGNKVVWARVLIRVWRDVLKWSLCPDPLQYLNNQENKRKHSVNVSQHLFPTSFGLTHLSRPYNKEVTATGIDNTGAQQHRLTGLQLL